MTSPPLPPLVWTLILLWTSGPSEAQVPDHVLYPALLSTASIECDGSKNPDAIFWFRTSPRQQQVQYLVRTNNAKRDVHEPGVDRDRFKTSKRGSTFVLRIVNVTRDDAGMYSCVLKEQKKDEEWRLGGTLLLPGEAPPVPPTVSKPKAPVKRDCKCAQPESGGCSSPILYTLVALLSVLSAAVVGTLYYFSRLPRKCRHHFVKKKFGS